MVNITREKWQRRSLERTANGGLNKGLTNTSTQMWAITTSVEIPMNTMKESGATQWTRGKNGSCATCQSVTKVRMYVFHLCEVFSSLKYLDIYLVSLGARLGMELTGSNTEGMNDILGGPLNILLQHGMPFLSTTFNSSPLMTTNWSDFHEKASQSHRGQF